MGVSQAGSHQWGKPMWTNIKRLALAGSVAMIAAPVAAQTYDLSANWRDPVFSYGYGDVGTSFSVFAFSGACVAGFDCNGKTGPSITNPAILKNISGAPIDLGAFHYSADAVVVTPGLFGEDAIVRFTVPVEGIYSISGSMARSWDIAGGNGLTAVVYAGGSLLGATLQPFDSFGKSQSFSYGGLHLMSGSTIDIGIDPNGDLGNDITELWASIKWAAVPPPPSGAIPEPASWAMMIGGFALAGGAMRRRAVRVVAV